MNPGLGDVRSGGWSRRLAWGFVGAMLVGAGLGGPLAAQEPVRAFAMGDPLPGRDAPAFALPYARAEGPGPADQPFILRAELGRVVVLAIVPEPADSAAGVLLRTLAVRHDQLFSGDVQVVVAAPVTVPEGVDLALRLGWPHKVLADREGEVRRLFGVDRRDIGVYVIGTSGRVAWRSKRFNSLESMSYGDLRDAVAAAWERIGAAVTPVTARELTVRYLGGQ